ncbi:hypothetical protein [Qipengyuania oceanensis]|uniref:Uncharacterized protein n=1 Tax=Qipengyuania oceanensis TaxID=1463597 RepID=A0A844YEA1_9SPHN|nr:hypothetical protein [Qipengyuania oceanensis]MXO61394.1 hypothetical protein [Qipengyuania oceanensis]
MTNIPYKLSCDPYDGARLAYFAIHPDHTDADWDDYVHRISARPSGVFDNFCELAELCREALEHAGTGTDDSLAISYAHGAFGAFNLIFDGLGDVMPISARVSHHFERYRVSLLRSPERHQHEI